MTKRIVGGTKDANGIYIKEPVKPTTPAPVVTEVPYPEASLDDIGKRIIGSLDRAVRQLQQKIVAGNVERDVVGALKDCQQMLKDLKKDEKDFLDGLSDEQLEKLQDKK